MERCCLAGATLVTYMTACPEDVRRDILKNVSKLLRLENFDPVLFCANETEQVEWNR